MRLVERDGWRYIRTTGSHHIYQHPIKTGIVVIPGHPGDDLKPGTWQSILKQAGLR